MSLSDFLTDMYKTSSPDGAILPLTPSLVSPHNLSCNQNLNTPN